MIYADVISHAMGTLVVYQDESTPTSNDFYILGYVSTKSPHEL